MLSYQQYDLLAALWCCSPGQPTNIHCLHSRRGYSETSLTKLPRVGITDKTQFELYVDISTSRLCSDSIALQEWRLLSFYYLKQI